MQLSSAPNPLAVTVNTNNQEFRVVEVFRVQYLLMFRSGPLIYVYIMQIYKIRHADAHLNLTLNR